MSVVTAIAAAAGQLTRQRLNAAPPARAQHDIRTLCGESSGRSLAEAAACTFYDDNFAFDVYGS
jgi:hypothetical protein